MRSLLEVGAKRAIWVLVLVVWGALGAALGSFGGASAAAPVGPGSSPEEEGCLTCHQGIEEMHPPFPLSCTDCHGGDPKARTKALAHVAPVGSGTIRDERVAPLDRDLAHLRFVNPMDLRVAQRVCGDCHGELVEHLMLSLHGTTAAHLSDGFFETGIHGDRVSRYSVFPIKADPGVEGNEVMSLTQPPKLDSRDDRLTLEAHFPDLVRKECMQCHLYSQGRAVRGRVGFDGEYRGAGCAACHVPYRVDGLSESADPTAVRLEPGHPARHTLVKAPATETCTTCHYGDASIGLHFRGLSQLPPGAAGGPEVEGTTDQLLHRSFFINDPAVTPPDVHHASGLHCVDCHTLGGVMGDGRLLSKMEQATEISCEACHGTFERRSDLITERGNALKHLFVREESVWMRSKVTGVEHRIKQAVDVVTPGHQDYNEQAARAMTGAHGNVACYTCHAGWNVNFLGFHFYRNEALSQMDLLTGERTPGRVTTQEKVFTTWKSFYAGLDEKGRLAPFLTGFSTMGTVDDADGERILDQELPVTQGGLSGLSMIHHQLHSTRPSARSCVECHRASETFGMGSANFQLGRQVVFVADRRGIESLAFDRENPQSSVPLAKFVLPDVVDLEVQCDPLQGQAQVLYASEGQRGIHVLDATDPRRLERLAFHMSVSPRGLALSGEHLFVADGVGGLKIFGVADPRVPELLATVPTIDAYDVEVRWPYAYVADGPGGLLVVDVRYPVSPKVVGGLGIEEFAAYRTDGAGLIDLDVLFQYSRPTVDEGGKPAKRRTPARRLVAVCDEDAGPILIDATEPAYLRLIEPARGAGSAAQSRRDGARYSGLALRTHVDLGAPQGGSKTVERDNLYFLEERALENGDRRTRLRIVDVSDPARPDQLSTLRLGNATESLAFGAWYNAPFLRPIVFVPGQRGVAIGDVSNSKEVLDLGSIVGLESAYVFAAETFPLDRMVDEDRGPLKDLSHPKSRWLLRSEVDRALSVPGEELGTVDPYGQKSIAAASSARALFSRADKDRSGLLTGQELEKVGGSGADGDGDGRVTLLELAELGADGGRSVVLDQDVVDGPGARTTPNGDLARLLDGLDPFRFERKKDGRLDESEFRAALFGALDLSGDGRLDVHELSRHPGRTRELRFGDELGEAHLKELDSAGGGSISPREFRVRPEEWSALDVNGDGFIQLDPRAMAVRRGRFEAPPSAEWPTRRLFEVGAMPPDLTADRLLETFDTSGDGTLSRRELRRREDLHRYLDVDRSSVVEADEVAAVEGRILNRGLETLVDDFLGRWDLDGDGEVLQGEIPRVAWTLLTRRTK